MLPWKILVKKKPIIKGKYPCVKLSRIDVLTAGSQFTFSRQARLGFKFYSVGMIAAQPATKYYSISVSVRITYIYADVPT